MRHGQEHELARVERRVVVRGEGEVGGAGEAWVLRVDARARQLVGRGDRELEVGVAQHETHQLDARKPRRTHDTRLDGHVTPSFASCTLSRALRLDPSAAQARQIRAPAQNYAARPLLFILKKKPPFGNPRKEIVTRRSGGC